MLGHVTATSSIYESAAMYLESQPAFLNAVVGLQTTLRPHPLLEGLHEIERRSGRDRRYAERYGPRSLDLDLLLYGTLIIDESHLAVPHPRMLERGFVLLPLAEVAPEQCHPVVGVSFADAAAAVRGQDLMRTGLELSPAHTVEERY